MTEMENKRFLEKIQESEEYAIRVYEAKTAENLVALLKEIDIEISTELATEYMAEAKKDLEATELDEKMLDNVNGGLGYLLTCLAFGAGAGVVAGLVVVGLYYAYRKYMG